MAHLMPSRENGLTGAECPPAPEEKGAETVLPARSPWERDSECGKRRAQSSPEKGDVSSTAGAVGRKGSCVLCPHLGRGQDEAKLPMSNQVPLEIAVGRYEVSILQGPQRTVCSASSSKEVSRNPCQRTCQTHV